MIKAKGYIHLGDQLNSFRQVEVEKENKLYINFKIFQL